MAQTHDIEDVLSSIRRLVANESGQTAKPKVMDGPMLVLEDSHRITEPEDPFQMIRALAQEERDGRDAEHLTNALPADLAAITTDLEEGSEAVAWDADEDQPLKSADEMRKALGNRDTPLRSGAPDRTVDVPSDYTEDTDYEAETEDAAQERAPEPEPVIQAETDATRRDVMHDEFQYHHHERAPEADNRATEEVVGAAEPDGGAADNNGNGIHQTNPNPNPHGEPDPRPAEPEIGSAGPKSLQEEMGRAGLADLSSSLGGDDALRDLIAEIVRQELSGELGERITRNVRKLVRREIRQILASDEID
ncbi:hypothetical protein SAMN05444004_1196 [Jannaschia faecimaris]|uniref:Uncharacterized protein n=1 Tax=Jannaschia faecimaris TaxID=1244108 RepID=A0A1H3TQS1_9RHOB|nr:hypothetical protein [Jannaschia faecimaris]SDZ52357.1 hypothetical protein SAMN05444004_1196 [Jannaschia faecimaris]